MNYKDTSNDLASRFFSKQNNPKPKLKRKNTRRKVGSLYVVIPYNNNFPEGYPSETVKPGNTIGDSILLPYNVPVMYLGSLDVYYAKIMYDDKICKLPKQWLSEKPIQ